MKAIHLTYVAAIAAVAGILTAIAQENSLGLSASALALATAFLPAITLVFPWYEPPTPKPS